MPQIIPTIEEYVATMRKEDTIYMVFNTSYNDKHAFKKKFDSLDSIFDYLDVKNTDYEAQKEFLDFMGTNFPDTKLQEVFDLVSPTYLQWSFLGSYAIDTPINSEVYKALEKKYENEDGTPKSNNAVLWMLPYENAVKFHQKRVEVIEAEFGEDE
jgi:hypothetical protein